MVDSKTPQAVQLHPLLFASVDEHLPGGQNEYVVNHGDKSDFDDNDAIKMTMLIIMATKIYNNHLNSVAGQTD